MRATMSAMASRPPYDPPAGEITTAAPAAPDRGLGGAPMTRAALTALERELGDLRTARSDIARGLREARGYGSGFENDEHQSVREQQTLLEARILALEGVAASAVVVDAESGAGIAAIGSDVVIEDVESGRQRAYRLASAYSATGSGAVSAASPMGQALLGARPDDVVEVELPSGRSVSVRLVRVESTPDEQSS